MGTTSTATTQWEGSLTDGTGTTELVTSGVATFDVTWGKRSAAGEGNTNPEELLAAALSTCYSMALSHALTGRGTPPTTLTTTVSVDFVPGTGITGATIRVAGDVPGIAAADFDAVAHETKENCPVSKALAGVPKTLEIELAG